MGTRLGPDSQKTRDNQPKGREKPARPTLKRDQCAYCKEQGHWKNECPKRNLKKRTVSPIYKEWGFLKAEGKEIKYLPEIRRLLAAVHLPWVVSIVHVPGHQKREDARAQGNHAADAAAHEVAAGYCQAHVLAVGLPPLGMGTLPPSPIYSPSNLSWMQDKTNRPAGKDG